ncbi:hypothetical protein [Reichenbachiella sp.]|uniref:hypothetical protein n=1 Tax=Reichenbachiella sp. TaxID=2184521 RepID=UPI003B5AF9FC
MALGKKPWQGSSAKSTHNPSRQEEREYEYDAFNFTSQYRSKKEANSTLKGGLILIGLVIFGILSLVLLAAIFGK